MEDEICQVYLILNEELFDKKEIKVEAYFTLSHRVLAFHGDVSKTTKKAITGFKDREIAEFVLIGQLGKYMDDDGVQSEIQLEDILDYAYEVIKASSKLIPCKLVLIECSEEVSRKGIYENCRFKLLQVDRGYYQYYKIL